MKKRWYKRQNQKENNNQTGRSRKNQNKGNTPSKKSKQKRMKLKDRNGIAPPKFKSHEDKKRGKHISMVKNALALSCEPKSSFP